ncbi:Mini-ribonuclease 3 [Calothrix rhizosoleniae]|uniref:Mini-ribonuclease 3 n=1 Tax=Calothrix rhizosoleniae TaxID=888997 RepID=UPI000B4986B9|nr:ribonuclease III domain-containing protein [Calothrix rhizosoleniae]
MKSKGEKQLKPADEQSTFDSSHCQIPSAITQKLTQSISLAQIQQISPSALAYLGDAVYELYVRMFYLLPPQRAENYHRLVVAQVRAETQAEIMQSLTPHLNANELEIVRRGRNAANGRPKRVKVGIYQQATSLETLIGYLYLTDYQRLTELLQKLKLKAS